MTEEVRYIVYPENDKDRTAAFDDAVAKAKKEMEFRIRDTLSRTGGILELESLAEGFVGQKAYFLEAVNGIICNLDEDSALEGHNSPELFSYLDSNKMMSICHLENKCGVLKFSEYKKLESVFLEKGWDHIASRLAIVLVDPICVSKEDCEMVYGIPIFRCEREMESDLAEYFIQNSFWPLADNIEGDRKKLQQLLCSQKNGGDFLGQPKLAKESDLKAIKDYYLSKGNVVAMLKKYPPEIFQSQKGSWDLYRFVNRSKESLYVGEGQWFEVRGMYARNPLEDVARDIDYVAIDFGTKSTVVAAFDSQSNINLIPVGMSADNMEKQYENPTIMRFVNVRQFLDAYQRKEYRPDTKFNDVSVSHSALNQFEGTASDSDTNQQEKMQQYLNKLKQWANNPNRKLQVVDGQGERYTLSLNGYDNGTIDPIELYAYYIGLSINNMHQRKIYLKYYLSYSATYSKTSRQQILSSFKKGLMKSLPEELKDLPGGLEKRFEVKMWYDEATAYAVCALNSYENHYRSLGDQGKSYLNDLKKGMFYSIYDFGGGTLDFSFGIMNLSSVGKTYTLLQCGGSSYLGCEYILEELAFRIFYNNRETLHALHIKCSPPSRFDKMQDDGGILADTSQAQFNTNKLITFLRDKWIGDIKDSDIYMDKELLFYDDSNKGVSLKINYGQGQTSDILGQPLLPSDFPLQDNNILNIGTDEIESFFIKQVTEGVKLFYAYREELIARTDLEERFHLSQKKCHIFLAGNASKAPRVETCFNEYLNKCGELDSFKIHPPLPTPWDEVQKSMHPGIAIPTAKSGVVHGLLMARPTAENVHIENEFPEVNFYYHMGSRSYAEGSDPVKGNFHLRLLKSEVPAAESMQFRRLREITQPMFELLYTADDSYAMKSTKQAVSAGIMAMVISVPEEHVGKYLYICAKEDSDVVAELGVSPKDVEMLDRGTVCIIGTCNFPKGEFSKKEADIPVQSVISEVQDIAYRLSILDSDWTAVTSDFSEDTINLEPVLVTEAENFIFRYQKNSMSDGAHDISVPMNAPGKKEVFVMKIQQGCQIILGYRTTDCQCAETFSVDLQTGHLETIGQQKG